MEELLILLAIALVLMVPLSAIMTIVILVKLSKLKGDLARESTERQSFLSDTTNLMHELRKLVEVIRSVRLDKTSEIAPVPKPSEEEAVSIPPPLPVQPSTGPVAPPPIPTVKPAAEQASAARPKTPSPFVESTKEVLGKIWNWIIVGEEHRIQGISMEYAVASTWLLRCSIVLLVFGVAFFLKWSIDQGLLLPSVRVAMSLFAGVVMLIGGLRLLGRKYHIIGQGLMGGGLAALYLGVYAAGPMYHLLAIPIIFALMILVTISAGYLAVRTNSLLMAILGIIGGYLTPVLLSTGEVHFVVLYSYLLILSLGILGIAHYKQWRLLNYLGFLFTYGVFLLSLDKYQRTDFPVAITFVSLFFVVHSSLVYFYNISKGIKSTILEIIHLVLNACIYSCTAYWLITNALPRPYPAIMSVSLAVFYVVHVLVFLRKRLVDRNLLVALIALAGFFTTWTMPLVFEKESLTIGWALQAFTFLWLGYKLNSNFIRNVAYLIYAIVFYRLLFLDMPRNFGGHYAPPKEMAIYWKQMAERLWTFGISIASVVAAFFVQRKQAQVNKDWAVTGQSDTSTIISVKTGRHVFYWFGLLFIFLFLQLEFNALFRYYDPLRLPMLTILWCAMALYFLWSYVKEGCANRLVFAALCVFLGAAMAKIFGVDLISWEFCHKFIYDMEYNALFAFMRLIDFGVVLGLLFAAWRVLGGQSSRKNVAPVFGYAGLFLLLIYSSLELNSLLYWRLPAFQAGGISILWALFAITFISGGIWKSVKALRYIGLILFLIVVCKVFLVDLEHLEKIYKVIAFLVVGVFLLFGSFAYIYSKRKFIHAIKEPQASGSTSDKGKGITS